jgi:hypothetical protein
MARSLAIILMDASVVSSKGSTMGWIIYNTASGRAERYYKLERTAKQQAGRLNKDPFRSKWEDGEFKVISYQAYEGVLMGLRGDNLKYWTWLKG